MLRSCEFECAMLHPAYPGGRLSKCLLRAVGLNQVGWTSIQRGRRICRKRVVNLVAQWSSSNFANAVRSIPKPCGSSEMRKSMSGAAADCKGKLLGAFGKNDENSLIFRPFRFFFPNALNEAARRVITFPRSLASHRDRAEGRGCK